MLINYKSLSLAKANYSGFQFFPEQTFHFTCHATRFSRVENCFQIHSPSMNHIDECNVYTNYSCPFCLNVKRQTSTSWNKIVLFRNYSLSFSFFFPLLFPSSFSFFFPSSFLFPFLFFSLSFFSFLVNARILFKR